MQSEHFFDLLARYSDTLQTFQFRVLKRPSAKQRNWNSLQFSSSTTTVDKRYIYNIYIYIYNIHISIIIQIIHQTSSNNHIHFHVSCFWIRCFWSVLPVLFPWSRLDISRRTPATTAMDSAMKSQGGTTGTFVAMSKDLDPKVVSLALAITIRFQVS